MKAIFHSQARDEAESAIQYYASIHPQLGISFEEDLQKRFQELSKIPRHGIR